VTTTPESDTWVQCDRCRFTGSSGQLVCQQQQIDVSDLALYLTEHGLSEKDAASVCASAEDPAPAAMLWLWNLAQSRTLPTAIGPTALSMLQRHDVYVNASTVSPSIGILYARDIKEARANFPGSGLKVVGGGGHRNYIAVPIFDVPGRVCSLALIHADGEAHLISVDGGQSRFTGGLGPSMIVPGDTGTVVAFRTALLAVQYQVKCLAAAGRWVDVVVPATGTSPITWGLLGDRKVVHIAGADIADAINHAVNTPNASVKRLVVDDAYEWVRTTPGAQLALDVENWSAPWTRAAYDWLFEQPGTIRTRFSKLTLTSSDLSKLTELCSRSEKQSLSKSVGVAREIYLFGCAMRDTGEAYTVVSAGKESQVSNIRINVMKTVKETVTGLTWLHGEVLEGDKRALFTVDTSTLVGASNVLKWLGTITAQNGMAQPNIPRVWADRLIAIATAFSNVDRVTVDRFYGWSDSDRCFRLPSIEISAKGVLERSETLPGVLNRDVWIKDDGAVSQFVASEDPRSVECAAMAVIITEYMLAQTLGLPSSKWVIGVPATSPVTLAHLAGSFGLTTLSTAGRVVAQGVIGLPPVCPYEVNLPKWLSTAKDATLMTSPAIAARYASLFPSTGSLLFPFKIPGVPSSRAFDSVAQAAARLAAEAVHESLKHTGEGSVWQKAVRAVRAASEKFGSCHAVDAALGRMAHPLADPAEWCQRYIKLLKVGIDQGYVSEEAYEVGEGTARVRVKQVRSQLREVGAYLPDHAFVHRQFTSAGLKILNDTERASTHLTYSTKADPSQSPPRRVKVARTAPR